MSRLAAINCITKVRDRITHPKRPADLDLSDEEVRDALEAYFWFDEQLGSILGQWRMKATKLGEYLDAILKISAQNFKKP